MLFRSGVMYNSQPYYYHRNLQGDVIAIYDANGEKQVEYAYDAWGNCEIVYGENSNLASLNPIRYRGYYYDTETGMYYLNARYYSPEWRRFISPDDTEYIDPETPNGLNLYAYCNNDPVNYADSTGHSVVLVLLGAFCLGAVTGGSISFATQLIENEFDVKDVNPWLVFSDAMFGGVSGLLAASGIGAWGSAFLSASLSGIQLAVNSAIEGERITALDFWVTTGFAFIGGFIPKAGINAKQMSGKWGTFSMHISGAADNSRRFIMYSAKLSGLKKDIWVCGATYVASTVGSTILSNHIINKLERYF